MTTLRNKGIAIFLSLVAGVFLLSPVASANMKEIKAYKEAFPDAQLKCLNCHAVAMPSKSGPHELNDYGQEAVAAEKEPTAATFQKLGKAEDFKKK